MGIFSTPANILTAQRAQNGAIEATVLWLSVDGCTTTLLVLCIAATVMFASIYEIYTHTPGEPETLLYDLMLSFGVCFFFIRLSFTEVRTTQSLYLNWGKLHYKQHTTANSLLSLHAQIHSNTFGYFNNNVKSNLYICRSELSVCHNVALNTNY